MNLPRRASAVIVNPRMWSLLKEFLQFCKQEKKWWLAPLLVLLLVLGIIVIFASSTAIAPLIYSIF